MVLALADAAPDPPEYVVEDASLTVTFWPAEVVIVKPDDDTLPTVPAAPPGAGPDRALAPPPPEASGPWPAASGPPLAAGAGDTGDDDGEAEGEDVAQPAATPATADIRAAAASVFRFMAP
jgi:hypothetical protein